jgi:Gas vesicle synthesis protein GvpL/GvpF
MNIGSRIFYLYGVVPCDQALPPGEGVSLEAIPYSGLAAVVESVSASEFAPETLEQQLQRVDWIAPLAQKHTAVLERLLAQGPVVPARLCTLFSSAHALTNLLVQNEQQFQDRLHWLKDRQEWGVKIFCHEDQLGSVIGADDPEVQALTAAAAAASPGQAYVLGKKRDARVAELIATRIEVAVNEVLDALAPVTVDTRLRSLLSATVTGRREAMVINAALLVDIAGYPAFRTIAEGLASRLAAEGFAVELTGPWPPYSFCEDDNDHDHDNDTRDEILDGIAFDEAS